jgi:hypothetical protein
MIFLNCFEMLACNTITIGSGFEYKHARPAQLSVPIFRVGGFRPGALIPCHKSHKCISNGQVAIMGETVLADCWLSSSLYATAEGGLCAMLEH